MCRKCNNHEETQKHILEEYTSIHHADMSKTTKQEIFDKDITTLKKTEKKREYWTVIWPKITLKQIKYMQGN